MCQRSESRASCRDRRRQSVARPPLWRSWPAARTTRRLARTSPRQRSPMGRRSATTRRLQRLAFGARSFQSEKNHDRRLPSEPPLGRRDAGFEFWPTTAVTSTDLLSDNESASNVTPPPNREGGAH